MSLSAARHGSRRVGSGDITEKGGIKSYLFLTNKCLMLFLPHRADGPAIKKWRKWHNVSEVLNEAA